MLYVILKGGHSVGISTLRFTSNDLFPDFNSWNSIYMAQIWYKIVKRNWLKNIENTAKYGKDYE